MTKEELINIFNDFNSKSHLTIEVTDEIIDKFDTVDNAYDTLIRTLIKEYITTNYIFSFHTIDNYIEMTVESFLLRNLNKLTDDIVKIFQNNYERILEYIIIKSKSN